MDGALVVARNEADAAARLVRLGATDEDGRRLRDEALRAARRRAAHGAHGVHLRDLLGDGHELGHRREGAAQVVLVETGGDDANAPVREALADIDDAAVEELRLVAGVTAEILYGEDANLNGILDANENDADESAPYDNRDSRLDPGLMEYFTVSSREPATGTNINSQADVQALLDSVLQPRASQIVGQLFPRRPPNVPIPPMTSVMEFYLRGGFTADEFALVADYLTATTNSFTDGLVNVNTASQAVLECIPGITNEYAAQLISYREANSSQVTSIAWVATAMNNDTNALAAGPYITTRSYQYTADVAAVGHHNRGYQRVRFVFDTSEGTPAIIHRQDLTHLGWALGSETREQLLAAKEATR